MEKSPDSVRLKKTLTGSSAPFIVKILIIIFIFFGIWLLHIIEGIKYLFIPVVESAVCPRCSSTSSKEVDAIERYYSEEILYVYKCSDCGKRFKFSVPIDNL